MIKRLFDVVVASFALVITSPLWLLASLGIAISSPGPIFYRATRIGADRKAFQMTKFRTMHLTSPSHSEITAPGDTRIFGFGHFIRALKIDELPQLLHVLMGEMSIVGPRPESSVIVTEHYNDWMGRTLDVAPGLTSVGALFVYSHGDQILDPDRPEESYVEKMLPAKLALELAYLERASFLSDLTYIIRTAIAIIGMPLGIKVEPARVDLQNASRWVDPDLLQIESTKRS